MSKLYVAGLIFIILLEALMTGLLPLSRGYFYDLLQNYDAMLYVGLALLFLNSIILDVAQSLKRYFYMVVALLKREEHTKRCVKEGINKVKNHDQRIQEDIKYSYQYRYQVYTEYAISSLILVGVIAGNIGQWKLVLGALAYALITVIIAYLFNPKMKKAEKIVQVTEADFRLKLSNCLSLGGFWDAQRASYFANRIRTYYLLFTKAQSAILVVLPYLVLIPAYLTKALTLGDVVQASTSFSLIVVNANILVSMFPRLTSGNASKERAEKLHER